MDGTVRTPSLEELQQQIRSLQSRLDDQQPVAKRKPCKADTLKYWTEQQVSQFFSHIDDPRDLAMFRVIYHRGLRASEVGRIQLQDYQVSRDRLRFSRLKGSHGGEYHLTSHEVRALKAWLRVRGSEPGPLFTSRQGSKGIGRAMIDILVKRYGKAAGIPPELCHAHALKHSCATHLMNRGESIEDVQDHLGHSAIASTLCYARYTNVRREARDKRLRDW